MNTVEPLVLNPGSRRAFERMAADGRRVLGNRFVALVAYSAADAVIFAERIDAHDLEALGSLAGVWHKDNLATPLVITPSEFRRSLDAFPIEYQSMIDRHVRIAGVNPFDGVQVLDADVRRACEIQAKSHLIHLRQGWIAAGGDDDDLATLAVRSAAPLRALLAQLVRLNDLTAADDAALAAAASRLAGVPADLIGAVLALDEAPGGAKTVVPRLHEYLNACEQLWAFIDRWRSG
jgi:hypothetical protein